MARTNMVYERGRLVPAEQSERLREAEATRRFTQGTVVGLAVGALTVTLGFTVGPAWAVLTIIVFLVALSAKSGGGGDTAGKAGNSVPGMGPT